MHCISLYRCPEPGNKACTLSKVHVPYAAEYAKVTLPSLKYYWEMNVIEKHRARALSEPDMSTNNKNGLRAVPR